MQTDNQQFVSLAFLWPALAAETASEIASVMAREFASLAIGPQSPETTREPRWTSGNKVALTLPAVRLRDFSTSSEGAPALVCAPFALHASTIADFAKHHSLVAALQAAGVNRVHVTDWRSATPEMCYWGIDDYLATLNVLIDELGGAVDLIGLCQGGWLALTYAARFPAKVRKLVLAGAPIDIAAGTSRISALADTTPNCIFKELVELGDGRVLGSRMLKLWAPEFDRNEIHGLLQPAEGMDGPAFRRLESRFRDWYAWTLDLPGSYYLEVVNKLFKANQLACGKFTALGQRIELARLRSPLFLLAARDDRVVAPEQIFAIEHLVDQGLCSIAKAVAPVDHLGLFIGRHVLSTLWADIAGWLQKPA